MKKFDFYEFAGILCPGALLVLVLARMFPELAFIGNKENFSFGDLGIFVVLSYVAGELVHAVGNGIEKLCWGLWSGLPSDWVRSGKHDLISKQQKNQLGDKLAELTNIELPGGIHGLTQKAWYAITRQMYAVVRYAGRSSRIDVFNGYYGMFRGLAASLLVVIGVSILQRGWAHPRFYIFFGIALILALIRMHRFGVNYARELLVEFLATQKTDKPVSAPKEGE